MEFFNGSGKAVDTIPSDNIAFYEMLAEIVNEEPADVFTPLERFYMQSIGIEKGKPFNPDAKTRACSRKPPGPDRPWHEPTVLLHPDPRHLLLRRRKWQYGGDVPYTFMKDGVLYGDRRAYVYYMALGNSPAMMDKNIGKGSYYLWTYKTRQAIFSTAPRTTSCTSHPTSRPRTSGPCSSTTLLAASD